MKRKFPIIFQSLGVLLLVAFFSLQLNAQIPAKIQIGEKTGVSTQTTPKMVPGSKGTTTNQSTDSHQESSVSSLIKSGNISATQSVIQGNKEHDLSGISGQFQFADKLYGCGAGSFISSYPNPAATAYTSSTESSNLVHQSFSGVPTTITSLRFWGLQLFNNGTSWSGCTSNPMPMTISFYNDNAGAPGSVVYTQNVSLVPVNSGELFAGFTVWEFNYTPTTPVALSNGWFSIQSTVPAGCWILLVNNTSPSAHGIALQNGAPAGAPIGFCMSVSAASCPFPTNLTASNITTTSADISWTPGGSETSWNVEWGTQGFTQGTGTLINGLTSPSTTLSPLNPSTNYTYYVQANCGGGNLSPWTSYTFVSGCGTFTAPFLETFQSTTFPPTCWTRTAGSGNWSRATTAGGYGSSTASALANFYSIQGTVPFHLATFDFTTAGMTTPQLRFDYAYATYVNEVDNLTIFYSTNGGATYTVLLNMPGGTSGILNTAGAVTANFVPSASQWATRTINLPAGTNKIRFTATSAYGNNLYVDNIAVIEAPTCPAPTALSATNITQTGATLSWTPGGIETSWQYFFGQAPLAPPTGAGIATSSSSVNVTGLTAQTNYQFYVRANCGANLSTWTGPYSFTTACGAFNPPLSENFESTTLGQIPTCWARQTNTVEWRVSNGVGASSGTQTIATFYDPTNAKNDWFFTPGMNLTGGTEYTISFYLRAPGWQGVGEALAVRWGNAPVAASMPTGNTIWQNTDIQYANYTQVTTNFTPATTGVYYFGWYAFSIADVDFISVDDISIFETPACPSPTALMANNITQTTATIEWTAGGAETAWEYVYGVAPVPTPTSGTMTTSTSVNLTGLTAQTDYQFWVRSFCNPDYSAWSGPYTFSTLCDPFTLPFIEDFEGAVNCWSVQDIDGGGSTWAFYLDNHTPGGSYSLGHIWGAPGYIEQGALFTPEIILPAGADIELSFWSYNVDAAFYDINAVLISTDGWVTSDVIWNPLTVAEATWEQDIVDISLYAGNTIQLAFYYEGDNAHAWLIDDIEIYEVITPQKTLDVTVFTEGLYIGGGQMRKAQDVDPITWMYVDKFGGDTADVVTLELWTNTGTMVFSDVVGISTTGTINVDIAPSYGDSYYIYIRHRNSIAVSSANPVSFAGSIITYNFSTAIAQAYFDNQKNLGSGVFGLFSGDVDQDGSVGALDLIFVDNASKNFMEGYFPEDVNGDAEVGAFDLIFVDNNSRDFVFEYLPF